MKVSALEVTLAISALLAFGIAELNRERLHSANLRVAQLVTQNSRIAADRSALLTDKGYAGALLNRMSLDSAAYISGVDAIGNRRYFRLRDLANPLIVYSIDVYCAACRANLPFVSGLAARSSCSVSIYGLLVDGTKAASTPVGNLDPEFGILENPQTDL